MKKRRLSREFAFRILYQRHVGGLLCPEAEITEEDFENFSETAGERAFPDRKFAGELVAGVCGNIEEIDSQIEKAAVNWKISRMSPIDVNIIRVAAYELLYMSGMDEAVSINEAVEIGHRYGTEKSGAFINGVLDRIRTEREVKIA